MSDGALDGVKVLDFTQMMLGPWAMQILGDFGADIVKVERPDGGDWERSLASMGELKGDDGAFFLGMNRNKRSLALDLKDPASKELILALVEEADIVAENYRPGVMDRLGFGYDELRRVNPAIIYASGSGYGQTGPYLKRPGQDLLIQAMSGMMSHTGPVGLPPVAAGTAVIDASSALMLVIGVLAALRHRDTTGEGQKVDVSLLGTAIALQCQELSAFQNLDQRWDRSGTTGVSQPWLGAPYGSYATLDGYIVLAMAPLELVAAGLEAPELLEFGNDDDAAFHHREVLAERIAARLAKRTSDEWMEQLLDAGLWVAPVQSFSEVVADPQVAALGLLQQIDHKGEPLHVVRTPIGLSATPVSIRMPPPSVGEHTSAIKDGQRWLPRADARE